MSFAQQLRLGPVRLVDGLLPVVERLMAKPDPDSPLWIGPGVFGERRDIQAITEALLANSSGGQYPVIIDLTLVRALGDTTRLEPLIGAANANPFAIVLRQSLKARSGRALVGLPLIEVDDDLAIRSATLESLSSDHRNVIESDLGTGTWRSVRARLLEMRFARLASTCIETPPPTHEYIRLPDQTAANKWIAAKRLLCSPRLAVECAYEIALQLTHSLEQQSVNHSAFIACNNTGYMLSCYLQRLFPDLPLFMIDRLGPYPHLSELRMKDLRRLLGHNVCVIEDVVSTGRELDLLHAHLRFAAAAVSRAFAVFDLEVARPLVVPVSAVTALCRASRYLDYRRYPHYSLEPSVN